MEKRLLPTALYCRLSREDGDRMESDSIGNQRKLLEAYIENHPELVMAECYADDGYTGTNFQRPAFQRMLRDIGNGHIRCVLVKDLSRFGRDYIETGRYGNVMKFYIRLYFISRFFPNVDCGDPLDKTALSDYTVYV